MKKITKDIKAGKILVSDGAWGTLLQAKGLQAGECPELWNIEHQKEVLDIASSYVEAGANIIETNSFGANHFKLEHFGLSKRTAELNKQAAIISKQATYGTSTIVMASIGPTGKILMMGDVSEDELYQAFKEQALALAEGGADAVCIETMSDLDEACIAIKAVRENTPLEIVCTMTFEKTIDNLYRSMMGVSPTDMVNTLIEAGADIIGANCGNGINGMVQIVKEIRQQNKQIPILIHANAGLPIYKDGKTLFPETAEEMATKVKELIDSGANVIGGCCGTSPEHIKKIAEAVENYKL